MIDRTDRRVEANQHWWAEFSDLCQTHLSDPWGDLDE